MAIFTLPAELSENQCLAVRSAHARQPSAFINIRGFRIYALQTSKTINLTHF